MKLNLIEAQETEVEHFEAQETEVEHFEAQETEVEHFESADGVCLEDADGRNLYFITKPSMV